MVKYVIIAAKVPIGSIDSLDVILIWRHDADFDLPANEPRKVRHQLLHLQNRDAEPEAYGAEKVGEELDKLLLLFVLGDDAWRGGGDELEGREARLGRGLQRRHEEIKGALSFEAIGTTLLLIHLQRQPHTAVRDDRVGANGPQRRVGHQNGLRRHRSKMF